MLPKSVLYSKILCLPQKTYFMQMFFMFLSPFSTAGGRDLSPEIVNFHREGKSQDLDWLCILGWPTVIDDQRVKEYRWRRLYLRFLSIFSAIWQQPKIDSHNAQLAAAHSAGLTFCLSVQSAFCRPTATKLTEFLLPFWPFLTWDPQLSSKMALGDADVQKQVRVTIISLSGSTHWWKFGFIRDNFNNYWHND